jgi:hypothetical protein
MTTVPLPTRIELEGTLDSLCKAGSDIDSLRSMLERLVSASDDAGYAAVMGVKWEIDEPQFEEAVVGRFGLFAADVLDHMETIRDDIEKVRELIRTLHLQQRDLAATRGDYVEWAKRRAAQLEHEAAHYRAAAEKAAS